MTPRPDAESAGGRTRAPGRPSARSSKLSRDVIVNAALSFLDREGWDALTINALATHLGTKGPSLYNHVDSLDDLRRTVRMRVIDDIIEMLNTVGSGRTRDDAVSVMASAYRSYAHHHPGRYSAFTRMPFGGDDPEYSAATRNAAGPVIQVLTSYGLEGTLAISPSICPSRSGTRPASSTSLPVRRLATISPVSASKARWSFRQDRRARPCFSSCHSPWPNSFKPVLSSSRCSGPCGTTRGRRPAKPRPRLLKVVWSGMLSSSPSSRSTLPTKPSA